MRVSEHLAKATRPLISFEIIPPRRGGDLRSLLGLVDELSKHRPPFIDITSHPAEMVYRDTPSGIERRVIRKRPGTLGVCALIQNKYNIDAVPHVLCSGFTREETEDFLIELRYLGIENVLVIRGDASNYEKTIAHGRTVNRRASDLVRQISDMNRGKYLDDSAEAFPTTFSVGVSGYPEKHFEAPNLESDVRNTVEKVKAGAEYIVTQMFFRNEHYFRYVDLCRAAGITVPIIPGIKILTKKDHLSSIPRSFHCEIPSALSDEIERVAPEEVLNVGVEWALQQTRELLGKGVPSVHFYVMQSVKAINALLAQVEH